MPVGELGQCPSAAWSMGASVLSIEANASIYPMFPPPLAGLVLYCQGNLAGQWLGQEIILRCNTDN